MWQLGEKWKKKERTEEEKEEEGEEGRTRHFRRVLRPDAVKAFTKTCVPFDPETLPLGIYTGYSQRFSYISQLI